MLAGAYLQDDRCSNREIVTVGQLADYGIGREQCIFHERSRALELFYRDTGCERASVETGDYIVPNKFRPRCLVLVSEADSAEQMLEDMLASGRVPTDNLQFNLSYATTTAEEPDYAVAATHTAISLLLQSQYGADLTGQDSFLSLVGAEEAVAAKTEQLALYSNTLAGVSVAAADAAELQQLRDKETALQNELAVLQANLDALRVQAAVVCEPSETHTCGRSSAQAPNPWVAADGTRCAGFETLEVYPGAFCARWGDPVSCPGSSCGPLARASAPCLSRARPGPAEERRCGRARRSPRTADRRAANLYCRGWDDCRLQSPGRAGNPERTV